MIDDSMSNVLCKYLEGVITMQGKEIEGLLGERDAAYATIGKKDEHIEALMEHIGHLTKSLDTFAGDKVKLQNEVAAYKANYQPLNKLIDVMEEDINDLEHEVLGLKDQRAQNHETIDRKNKIIKGLEDQVLAVQIQAAEAEHRADEEKRGRLQLVMRL